MLTVSLVFLIAAIVFALVSTFGGTIPRINLIGAALASYFLSVLFGAILR